MVPPDNNATDPWQVVLYETEMLRKLYELMGEQKFKELDDHIQNAVIESACLHARILADILLSKGSTKDGDIRLNDLLGAPEPKSVAVLRSAYGYRDTDHSPCWTFNKMLAHATKKRTTSFEYTQTLNELLPHINNVLEEINTVRSAGASGALPRFSPNPNLCAKTSS